MLHLLEELGKACGRALPTLVTPRSKEKEHSFTFVTLGFQKGTGGEMENPGPTDDGMKISGLCPTMCCRQHSIHCPENPTHQAHSGSCLPNGRLHRSGVPPYPSRPLQAGGGPVDALTEQLLAVP